MLSQKLLEILACPACKSEVNYDQTNQKIICLNQNCQKEFSVKDNIPMMILE